MGSTDIVVIGWLTVTAFLPAQLVPLRVSPEAQEQRLIYSVCPVYPKLAKEARIQGTVRLVALIDEFGNVKGLKLISGHPFLVKAAMDAVKQWRYRPAMYGGVPVPVITIISVTFSLGMDDGRSAKGAVWV